MLESMSSHDLKSWEAFFYVDSGAYHEKLKKKKSIDFHKALATSREIAKKDG